MKKLAFLFLSAIGFPLFSGAQTASDNVVSRPKLVIGLVVDQMRWDYLYRFYNQFGNDGFKRLLNDGYRCEQTFIDYLPCYTAPGHTCIYTGSVPAIHGIAGNDWIENATGQHSYCVQDNSVRPTGGGSIVAGSMSPRNLLTTTITDELRLATNMASRTYGISLKDRGSILPAGHLANGAFWYDDSTGKLISSTYYGTAVPDWVEAFNQQNLPQKLLAEPWVALPDARNSNTSEVRSERYEGLMPGEQRPDFPHKAPEGRAGFPYLRRMPAGNVYSFAAARACMQGTGLGKGDATDFLCLSLSTPDYIGHQYAPRSKEVEDQYRRLDLELADFLRYLDKELGKGNYLFFLTADHGGADNSRFLEDNNIPGGNLMEGAFIRDLAMASKQLSGIDSLTLGAENYQIYFSEARIEKAGKNREELKQQLTAWLKKRPEVAYVVDLEAMYKTALPYPIAQMVVNGYHARRSGVLQVILHPGWYAGYLPTGTTHGTWHPYDAHIPLVFYGWNIPSGSTSERIAMQDISPTLAHLLKIQAPNGSVGKVIPLPLKSDKR